MQGRLAYFRSPRPAKHAALEHARNSSKQSSRWSYELVIDSRVMHHQHQRPGKLCGRVRHSTATTWPTFSMFATLMQHGRLRERTLA